METTTTTGKDLAAARQLTLARTVRWRTAGGPESRFGTLSELLVRKPDLRGAYAPADYMEEAVRWSA